MKAEVKLLIGGKEAFTEILHQINSAENEIYICIYIWRNDEIGNEIAKALLDAADRSVRITIKKDKLGSLFEKEEENRSSFFHTDIDLTSLVFRKLLSLSYFRYLWGSTTIPESSLAEKMRNHANISLDTDTYRFDHSKYYLFDHHTLITGGINIEDKERTQDWKNRRYHDYMVVLQEDERLKGFPTSDRSAIELEKPGVIIYQNIPVRGEFPIKDRITSLLDSAEQTVDIEMAYWGDHQVSDKIVEIANAGIQVSIISSRQANLQDDLNKRTLQYILKSTENRVRVYLSRNMVHAKFFCVDQKTIFIGSANFTRKSMTSIGEIAVEIREDKHSILKWRKSQNEHFSQCSIVCNPAELSYHRLKAGLESFV